MFNHLYSNACSSGNSEDGCGCCYSSTCPPLQNEDWQCFDSGENYCLNQWSHVEGCENNYFVPGGDGCMEYCDGSGNSCDSNNGTVTDIDGNVYETVQIGEQVWLKENLKVTHYRNGDEINYYDYDDDPSYSEIYGRFYDWYAIDDDRGVCPEGFHISTDWDWTKLITYLDEDMLNLETTGGYQSWVAGGMLKSTGTIEDGDGLWHSPNEGATNESGFTSLPAGYNSSSSGLNHDLNYYSYYWSHGTIPLLQILYHDSAYIYRSCACDSGGFNVDDALSIRCLQDDEITTGCTDPEACNYDETATADDGSCEYEYDCAGDCGGDLILDCGGVCGGDNSTALNCCGLPFNDDCTDDCVTDDLGQCCTPQDVDECGVCYGDDYSCTEFACVTDCQNFDDISGFLDNDCVVCDFLEDDAWNNVCSEDCGFDFWYLASNECDWECNIWGNQDECQSYGCIWDDSSDECNNWPNYSECEEVYDEAYGLGLEEGILLGGQSGDANGDGTLDILDIVYFIDVILNP